MTNWNVTPTGAGSTFTFAEAHRKAKAADTLDMNGTFKEIVVTKDGLTLDMHDAKVIGGRNPALLLLDADSTTVKGGDYSGSSSAGIASRYSDHIDLLGVSVHDNARNGISFMLGDHLRIAWAKVHHNATAGPSSGISVYHPLASDDAPGFHIVIQGNEVYANGSTKGRQSDAFGIVLDDFRGTQPQDGQHRTDDQPSFDHDTLIFRNHLHDNGGPGLGVVWGEHVTVQGNRAHDNMQQAEFGRLPDVDFLFRDVQDATVINNTLGGKFQFSSWSGRPTDIEGHGNTAAGHYLQGAAVDLPDYEHVGVQAATLHFDQL